MLGAVQIMHLYRTDRAALVRLAALESQDDAGAEVLHPLGQRPSFSDASALASAYQSRSVVPLPSNARALGLAYNPGMGSRRQVDAAIPGPCTPGCARRRCAC